MLEIPLPKRPEQIGLIIGSLLIISGAGTGAVSAGNRQLWLGMFFFALSTAAMNRHVVSKDPYPPRRIRWPTTAWNSARLLVLLVVAGFCLTVMALGRLPAPAAWVVDRVRSIG